MLKTMAMALKTTTGMSSSNPSSSCPDEQLRDADVDAVVTAISASSLEAEEAGREEEEAGEVEVSEGDKANNISEAVQRL